MNSNEIRFYMYNLESLKEEIKNLQEALDIYSRMDISGIKSQVITDMPICHSNTSKTEHMAVTRVDYIQDLKEEIDSKVRLITAIHSVYLYLEPHKKEIIDLRYMKTYIGRSRPGWKEIADIMNKKYPELYITEGHCRLIDMRIILRIQNNLLRGPGKKNKKGKVLKKKTA
jgi:hypothetical protein